MPLGPVPEWLMIMLMISVAVDVAEEHGSRKE